ncbi:MAG: helix-turn-helix domain-containing protein [Bdellovibrionales bacterium]
MTQIRKIFSKNLKRLRNRKGLTQEDLAERLDISVRYIQQLEGKNCPNVKIDTIAAIAKILNTKPEEFLSA